MKATAAPSFIAATFKHVNLRDSELAKFRTKICEKHRNQCCLSADCCANSHCQTWQRRNPTEYMYSSKLCPDIEFIKQGKKMSLVRRCSRGRRCMFAHSKEEELYHPNMYKTKMCNSHPNCTRYYCPFAHSQAELRQPTLTRDAPTNRLPCSVLPKPPGGPASPVSGSTTASSAAASPFLSSFSPLSTETKAPTDSNAQQLRPGTNNTLSSGFVQDEKAFTESNTKMLGLELLPQTPTQSSTNDLYSVLLGKHRMSEQNDNTTTTSTILNDPPFTPEESEIYSNILIHILQKEGLTAKEKMFLERIKLGDNSTAPSLLSYDNRASDSAGCLPPGLCDLLNTKSEVGRDPHRRHLNYNPHKQYSHDGRIRYSSRYTDHHNSRWDQHSNIATTLVPYYGHYRTCREGSSLLPLLPPSYQSEGFYPNGNIAPCVQCNSKRDSYGRHRQRYHREGGRLSNNLGKQDFGGIDFVANDHMSDCSSPRSSALNTGSDPLVLLSALTLLNSVTPEDRECFLPARRFEEEDATTPLIAEILQQLSQTSRTNVDNTMKEKPGETHADKLDTST